MGKGVLEASLAVGVDIFGIGFMDNITDELFEGFFS